MISLLKQQWKQFGCSRNCNHQRKYLSCFTVKNHPAKTKKSNGEYSPTLPVGTKIAKNCSTTGSSYHGYMLFRKMKSGSSWVNIGSESYVFVDLGMSYGTMPDSRNIR